MGDDTVVLTTGGRSEDFARKIFDLPDHSFVQFGDFLDMQFHNVQKRE
jgi:Cobalamin biosynthesis protein CbiD